MDWGNFRKLPIVPSKKKGYIRLFADANGVLKIEQSDGTVATVGGGTQPVLSGSGAPSDSDGVDGQLYIDTDAHDIYLKAGGSWT